jgi:electron transfer flavoprotein alpha subunit
MTGTLVYSERASVALELLSFAATLKAPTAVALLGDEAGSHAEACFAHGAERAYVSADPALAGLPADVVATALRQIAEQATADVVLIGSTLRGREIAARLAQQLRCGCITDATSLRQEDGRLIATRYALGGNTVATQTLTSAHQVIAVMPQTFEVTPRPTDGEQIAAQLTLTPSPVTVVARHPKAAGTVDVAAAEVVVCVGRGIEQQEDLAMIQELAQALGGVVGCTRPISHDNHWLSEDQMIGISGKIVSPRLYIGIGLSGQIQHTVGVLGAKVTAAINQDRNALIFNAADYGIEGDLYEVVPRLVERLRG